MSSKEKLLPNPHFVNGKAHYSLRWALSVVENLAEKYPRATKLTLEAFDLTPELAARFLAANDSMWGELRKIVKAEARNKGIVNVLEWRKSIIRWVLSTQGHWHGCEFRLINRLSGLTPGGKKCIFQELDIKAEIRGDEVDEDLILMLLEGNGHAAVKRVQRGTQALASEGSQEGSGGKEDQSCLIRDPEQGQTQ